MNAAKSHLARILLASLALLAAAGPAAAAPGWNPPLAGPEKTSHSPEFPLVGIDSAGTVVTAWSRFDPGQSVRVVEARLHPAGGPLGPALQLSTPAVNVQSFDLAVGANGTAVVVWREGEVLIASVRPPGGTFGPRQPLPKPAGETAITQAVDVDGAGNATVLWATVQGATGRARVTTIPAGGAPSPAGLIHTEAAAHLSDLALAVDATGRAHALWVRSLVEGPNRTTTVQRAYRPPAGSLAYAGDLDSKTEAPFNAEAPAGLQVPQVAVDAQGAAVAIWFRPGTPRAIRWSAGPAGGAFSPAATLAGGEPTGRPQLGMSASGEALVGAMSLAAPHAAWVYRRPPGGTFGPPETVADDDVSNIYDLATGVGGETVLTWVADAGQHQPRAAYRSGSSAPWVRTDLGPAADSVYSGTLLPAAAVNAAGDAAVAWSIGVPSAFHTMNVRYEAPRGAGPIAEPADKTRPAIANLRMARKAFAVSGRKRGGRVKRGSAFRFRLSERAQVRIRIERIQRGRKRAGRCRVGAKAGRRCIRFRKVGVLVRKGRPAGANRIRFTGRIGKRALRPGLYRATLRALDAAGNRSMPRTVRFRILRPR